MHDKPGVIVVDLTQDAAQVKQDVEDALSSGAAFVFATDLIAVFAHGYAK